MLESIYGMKGGPTDALARYLASIGPAAGKGTANSRYPGGVAPGSPGSTPIPGSSDFHPQVNQDGSFTPGPSSAASSLAGQGQPDQPLGHDLPSQSYDYSTDPVLQQMLAGGAQDETDADARALGARRSVLGQYGDRNLASSVLGEGDPTLGSISDDPDTSTSTIARLKRSYGQTVHDSEEAMNANNLFYGGARIKRLGDLAKDEQTQQGDANSAVHNALDQISAALGQQKAGIRNSRAQAEADAAARAAQAAFIAALAGGGGGGSGAPVGTPDEPMGTGPSSGAAVPTSGSGIPSTPVGTIGEQSPLPGGLGSVSTGSLGLGAMVNDPAFKARLAALGLV